MSVPHVPPRPPLRRTAPLDGIFQLGWTRFLELADPYPHWRHRTSADLKPALTLVPAECTVRLTLEGDSIATVVAEGPSYVLTVSSLRELTYVMVAAASPEGARSVLDAILIDATEEEPDEVPLSLWRSTDGGAQALRRQIEAPAWAAVSRNYPRAVATSLGSLMELCAVSGSARLMLLSGEPGTGKTSAVRALMREWRPWCASHLVVDPERLFDDAAYLVDVLTSPTVAHKAAGLTAVRERGARWNLVICEDADAFLRTRGRLNPGAGISRLLNLADGLLGQGSRTLVLLTVNLPDREIDRAVLRPGRCLAHVEFGRLSPTESRAWLQEPDAHVPPGGLTLAELYARVGDVTPRVSTVLPEDLALGAYL